MHKRRRAESVVFEKRVKNSAANFAIHSTQRIFLATNAGDNTV